MKLEFSNLKNKLKFSNSIVYQKLLRLSDLKFFKALVSFSEKLPIQLTPFEIQPKHYLLISPGEEALVLLLEKKGSSLRVVDSKEYSIPVGAFNSDYSLANEELFIRFLRQVTDDFGKEEIKLTVPICATKSTTIYLPGNLSSEEIKAGIVLEAQNYKPWVNEEALVSAWIVGKKETETGLKTEIATTLLPKSWFSSYQRVFEKEGLFLRAVYFEPEIWRSALGESFGAISFKPGFFEIYFATKGVSPYGRFVHFSGDFSSLESEVLRTQEYFKAKGGEVCRIYSIGKQISNYEEISLREVLIKGISGCLNSSFYEITEDYVSPWPKLIQRLTATALICTIGFSLGFGVINRVKVNDASQRLVNFQKQKESIDKAIAEKLQEVRVSQIVYAQNSHLPLIFPAISEVLPKGVTLSRVFVDEQGLSVEGKAENELLVYEAISAFERLGVVVLSNFTPDDGRYNFSISLEWVRE